MGQAIEFGTALVAGEAVTLFDRSLGYILKSNLLRRGGGLARCHLNGPSKGGATQVRGEKMKDWEGDYESDKEPWG